MARPAKQLTRALAAATVGVLAAGCGAGMHHTTTHRRSTPNRQITRATETSVARAFATAYLAYLDGHTTVIALPHATAAVRAAARGGGTVPERSRQGQLTLVALEPAPRVKHGVLLSARNRAGTLYAQETLARTGHGWRVSGLLTPDFVQAFVKQSTATTPQPLGSAGAGQSARTFLAGYLPYYYGHAPAAAVRADAPALAHYLRAHPPNIPPALQRLDGRVAGIAMAPAGDSWRALVNVHDARSTYQLTLTLAHLRARWVVTAVSAQ